MHRLLFAALAPLVLHGASAALAAPVKTIDGVTIITMADIAAGGVTAGDAPGFPLSINTTGTYRLGERLSVSGATNGISVNIENVTLDFNGFYMGGNAIGLTGIVNNRFGLTVKNGTVRNFTQYGIASVASGLLIDNMRFADNQLYGIDLRAPPGGAGGRSTVRNSILFHNNIGVLCAYSCLIEGNVISANDFGVYIRPQGAASVLNNLISDNTNTGIYNSGGSGGFSANSIVNNFAAIGGSGSLGRLGPNYCFPTPPSPVPAVCNP